MALKIRRSNLENILIVAILSFAPLALGSVHTWSYCTLAFLALILFNMHFFNNTSHIPRPTFYGTQGLHGQTSHVVRPTSNVPRPTETIGALVFLAVALFYIVPLPPEAIKLISPNTWNLWQNYTIEPPSLMTISPCVHATMLYLVKLVTYLMVFLVIVSKCRTGDGGGQISDPGCQIPDTDIRHQASGIRYQVSGIRNQVSISYILLGALCAVLSVLIHSLSDFNLHIPANALYFTVMLALITGLSTSVSKCQSVKVSKCGESRGQISDSGCQIPDADIRYQVSGIRYQGSWIFLSFLTHALIVIGFIVAVFGILQKLSYNGKIYWLIEKNGAHFGPYINYDHYAGFMEMCAIFTIAVFIGNVASSSFAYTRRFVDKVIWFSTKEANKCLMYLFLAVVMATALFMTASRGGIMSFIAACAVLYFVCLISAESRKRKRMLLATFFVIVLIVIMFSWVGPEETIDKFKVLQDVIKAFINESAILSELRPLMWHDTLNMIKDFPITGTGLGSYSYIFSKYRTFEASYGFLRFAHNDYLHFLAEMGAVGATFLVGFFVWYVRKFRNCVRRLRKVEN